jgi:hypothetical protein
MIVHPILGSGKTIVIGDPNVVGCDKRKSEGSTIFDNAHMVALLRALENEFHITEYWINNPRGKRNTDGECLRFALEWMVEVVSNGLDIQRDKHGAIKSITGFRKLEKLEKKDKKVDK